MMMSGEEAARVSFGTPAFVREPPPGQERARARVLVPALGAAMSDLPGVDPLANLLAKHLPTHLRPRERDLTGAWPSAPPGENDDPFVTDDGGISESSVQHATRTNAWRKIATLARSHIDAYPDATPASDGRQELEDVLQWWTVRLYALARLRLFSMLGSELTALWHILATTPLDPAPSLLDTDLVPFALRALKAMEPQYCRKNVASALEHNCALIADARTSLAKADPAHRRIWQTRVLQLTLNQGALLCEAKDFSQAIDTLHDLATHLASADDWLGSTTRVLLLLFLARVWVQAGSLRGAEKLVDAAAAQLSNVPHDDRQALENEIAISRGTLCTMRCDFPAASAHFTSVNAHAKQDIQARSNLALSTFYTGELSPAIETLESLLATHPGTAVNAEPFLFNLTTLLELRSEDVLVDKRRILAVLGEHATDASGVLTASGLKL